MTARRILAHLTDAVRGFAAAKRYAGTSPPIECPGAVEHAKAACDSLGAAVALISPEAGARVAAASRRAFEDAHRRAVARRVDSHADGLDEGGAASCAAEGTGGLVVDVAARAADEEGLAHGGEHGTPPGFCDCEAPVVPAVWVDLRTMRAVEDSVRICSRCKLTVGPGMVQ